MRKPQPAPAPVATDGVQVVPIPVGGPQAVPIDAPAADPASDLQTYAKAVSRAVRAHLILPPNVPESAHAIYEITLSGKGAVAQLRAVRRSGFLPYDAAIRRAVQRAQPFPQFAGAHPTKPTALRLTFKVKD